MQQHHTEPTPLRVGDDNLCAISLGKEDEEFADTMRMAVSLTSPIALLRVVRLRTIVIYLTESEFDPSELLVHPFSQTVREAGELGGNTGYNKLRRTAMGMRKKARKTPPASLALRAEQRPIYTLTLQMTAHHHSIIGGTRGTDRTAQWRKGKAATSAKHKKKQPRGRSHSGGTTRNRSRSKPHLSGTHASDSECETDDKAAQPSRSSHE
eukprot:jgi/Tetstr1/423045/TSEL_013816.t1